MGSEDLAALLHVKTRTFRSWVYRAENTGCPQPFNRELNLGADDTESVDHPKTHPLWDASEVIRWWVNWRPIKSPRIGKLGYVEPQILKELGIEDSNGQ